MEFVAASGCQPIEIPQRQHRDPVLQFIGVRARIDNIQMTDSQVRHGDPHGAVDGRTVRMLEFNAVPPLAPEIQQITRDSCAPPAVTCGDQ